MWRGLERYNRSPLSYCAVLWSLFWYYSSGCFSRFGFCSQNCFGLRINWSGWSHVGTLLFLTITCNLALREVACVTDIVANESFIISPVREPICLPFVVGHDSVEASMLISYLLCISSETALSSYRRNGACFPKLKHTTALYLKEWSQCPHSNLRFNIIPTVTSRHMLDPVQPPYVACLNRKFPPRHDKLLSSHRFLQKLITSHIIKKKIGQQVSY